MDEFKIKIAQIENQNITKRTALSDISRIFDPLGFIARVTATAKIFLQQLWKLKIDWDAALPRDMQSTWHKFKNDLKLLENINIPRHIFGHKLITDPQVHIFADASEQAYGAVSYIRSIDEHKTVIVRLLCARSRVAPTKQITLPRLELCAAKLAVDLMQRLQEIDYFKKTAFFLWSDSTAVLGWINAQSSNYHTFIANRISAIQQISSPQQWRHVRSEDNPADLISRGLTPNKLVNNNFWFYGPIFLHGAVTSWPLQPPREECSLEIRTSNVISATVGITTTNLLEGINHKNSFRRLQRIIAYIYRFIKTTRTPRATRPIHKSPSPDELDTALFHILRTIQISNFSQELKQLRRHQEVERTSSITTLSPFIDERGIVRVGGRLESSALPYDSKHPMLIPYNDLLIKLLFIMVHEDNKHCGAQALLGIIRQRFWPIKGKTTARATVQQCIICNKARPKLFQQIMGNLPPARVTPARPFINAGVDYCGPFWIHYKIRGERATKAYIAVFCCFATKAVHLELVSDLSTEAFIGALKRFISRRGRCQNIYSDNATNFVGAKNQLSELAHSIYSDKGQETIFATCSTKGIQFHFIPPRAPHFGGLWEAAVKSAKHLLQRSMSTASLTYEELETVIVEVEAILNSRPLTPMSNDPTDLTTLTPGHLLIGEALTAPVDNQAETTKLTLLSRWELVSQLKHDFWKRWSTEYLNELQQRHKWKTQSANIKPGDMVIIKEDNVPVMHWPLGRIVQVYKGADGAVRVVDVKTAKGIFKRAIHRLAPLPVNTEDRPKENDEQGATPPPSNNDKEKTVPLIRESRSVEGSDKFNLTDGSERRLEKHERRINTQRNVDEDQELVSKKRQKRALYCTPITILAILLMLPIVLCSPIKIEKFDPAAGIHFEHIGTSQIIASEWNLVIFYDLKPLFTEIELFTNGTYAMQLVCQQLQQKTLCEDLVIQFLHTGKELAMDSSFLTPHRQKRGAINFVGNVANSLFGLLDSEYANQMSETIATIENNEQQTMMLVKQQTSIIDSTINIMKHDQIIAQKTFAKFEEKFVEIVNMVQDEEQEVYNEKLSQIFLSQALQLMLTSSNIRRIQSAIINVLINAHHGQISPHLLSPQQLDKEIAKITTQLPPTRQIPGYHGNLPSIYKFMKVQGSITKRHAIFRITIPLTESDQFELYRLIAIPTWVNNTMLAIKPSTSILATTLHRDKYFPINTENLQSCTKLDEEAYLCPNTQPIYNKGSTICSCEVNLFNNETSSLCEFVQMDDYVWIQTNQKNRWIFALAEQIQVTAVCDNQVTQIPLEGSGFLQLAPSCVIKHKHLTLLGSQIFSSEASTSYTSIGHLTEVKKPSQPKPLLTNTVEEQYTTQLKELTALQQRLESHQINELPNALQEHRHHSFAVGYTALTLSMVLVIAMLLKHYFLRKQQESSRKNRQVPIHLPLKNQEVFVLTPPQTNALHIDTNTTPPRPRPRQHSFTIDV